MADVWLTNNESDPVDVAFGDPTGPDAAVFAVEPKILTVQPGA